MANIGGNITGIIQKKDSDKKNAIGERVASWVDAFSPIGWLGLQSGDSKYSNFSAKIEESTHVFLCDFDSDIYALSLPDESGTAPIVRMVIKGIVYDVLLIDNPDELDEQLEIYLRRVGAFNG
jgi:hypothetical protein